uniref:FeoA family protein n=1 Tax=Eubacterium cellulosolvens TaxID=29322 RepID=UPI000484018F|nr:FeoA family protein [[Eubacterium] cellulosolvens]
MLPLNMADAGQTLVIKKIGGTVEVKKHLEDLGFYVGGDVCIVSSLGGNLILKVKEARIALSEQLAQKIMV